MASPKGLRLKVERMQGTSVAQKGIGFTDIDAYRHFYLNTQNATGATALRLASTIFAWS
jgi:hypothetical protein